MVESTSSCISEHSLEHALSAFHHELPHGAGLIMLSQAYFTHFSDKVPQRFKKMAEAMGAKDFVVALKELQEACGVGDLKMSDYGIKETELEDMAKNARDTMGFLFTLDPVPLSHEDALAILKASYK
jgi:alcohol dehydrogenase